MKLSKIFIFAMMIFACAATAVNAQFSGMINTAKSKVKKADSKTIPVPKTESRSVSTSRQASNDDSDTRAENAKTLAKAAGMPKPANTDAALNKMLFQAADDTRLIPRPVIIVDKDWLIATGARNEKVRRIFAVIGRTLDDGSGKCGKQMVQFDQDWKADKNIWGLIYVQNIGEITPIACSAIGK